MTNLLKLRILVVHASMPSAQTILVYQEKACKFNAFSM